jgi:hypothetical protein
MDSCPTCSRPFEKMTDYPSIKLDKVEIPSGGIFGVDSGWDDFSKVTPDGRPIIDEVWDQISELDSVKDYLSALKGNIGKTVNPKNLLPPWKPNGYFRYAYLLQDEDSPPEYDEETYTYKPERYLAFQDDLPFQERDAGICHVAVMEPGPNFGSAGGPTLKILGVIATFYYTPILTS